MLDIKIIKENPEKFDQLMSLRGVNPQSYQIIKMHNQYLENLSKKELLQMKRNEISRDIGLISKDKNKSELSKLKERVKEIKEKIQILEGNITKLISDIEEKILVIPNIIDKNTPKGNSEIFNEIVKKNGKLKKFEFEPKNHVFLGEKLGVINYEQAIKLSGSRFSVIKGDLALLSRALITFMLEEHVNKNSYQEVIVPELVKSDALYGTGQLPKFKSDLFQTSNDLWLIPTAEVCLTNLHRNEIIDMSSLPIRYTSFTNCFRSEAGSAGMDTQGLIREHQFGKVELVSITKPENSAKELERMTSCVENIIKKIDLPYQMVKLCSGDLGFSSSITLDFEVWMPGQNKYREVSSCSNCKCFQSRRMKLRVKDKFNKKTFFPHTLNGSGLAIGRMIVAIMENYQQENGNIYVPDILQEYMGGKKEITKIR